MTKKAGLFTWLIITACILSIPITAPARTIHVDDDATGVKNGPSRSGFQSGVQYPSIQAAIDAAVDGDTIILAPGTFRGDGNRDIDFKGKAITLRSIDPNDPDIVAATIIDCNGTDNEPHRGFYFHNGEDAKSILAGVTIMNGYAEDGGGVYCESSSPTLRKCNFTRNSAQGFEDCSGGGMYNYRSSPTLLDCTFRWNSAFAFFHGGGSGGGIHNRDSSPTLTNCTFENNSTAWAGGGMRNSYYSTPMLSNCTFGGNSADDCGGGMDNDYHSNPTLTNCTFSGNSAAHGGGIHNDRVSPMLTNCSFSGNSASYSGGGMENYNDKYNQCSPTLIKCTFANNRANKNGGGISNSRSSPTLTNCTLSGNSAEHGAGMYIYCGGKPILTNCLLIGNTASNVGGGISAIHNSSLKLNNCTFALNSATNGNALACYHRHQEHLPSNVEMTNCVLWDGGDEVWNNDGSEFAISYSDIQGGWQGEGNIDADPCFVDPNSGDYHLRSERGRYWPEHDVWVLDKVTSPCIDAGDPYDDPSAEPLPNGDLVNMGAYGATAYASMSEWALRGDLNHDGIVNMIDFTIFGDYWLQPSLRAREIDGRLVCENNLRALGRALHIYGNDYDDESPTPGQWCDLLLQYEDVTEELFVCPTAEPGRSHYAINPNSMGSSSPPDMVWLFETGPGWNQFGGPELLAPENHQGKGTHILFHDGHVEFVRGERVDELRWERK